MAEGSTNSSQGQALVNSQTFWGSILTAASGAGVWNTIGPFITTALSANGISVTGPEVDTVLQGVGILLGLYHAIQGRKNASQPITGLVKP